jgi:nitrilase
MLLKMPHHHSSGSTLLTIGLAQITPVWMDRECTIKKVVTYIDEAARQGCQLVAFGEAFVPGYPFWLELTGGAHFNSPLQKGIFAEYASEAVQLEAGHLDKVRAAAERNHIAVYLGCVERPADRGSHSLYCSLFYFDAEGAIGSVHRKLMPTYEERLVWSTGDGHGLQVHDLGAFRVGGLNCWENWMPLTRSALYAQGENLHVAVWPGSIHNTVDITRFIALESRSFVASVSGLMLRDDIGEGSSWRDIMGAASPSILANGGSCIAGPDGEWIVPPTPPVETLLVATIDQHRVLEERQNFDPSGHYARPDVLRLVLDRRRQNILAQE